MAIEILSPSTRKIDEVIKRRAYARWGVGEYWVVDPKLDVVKVYRRGEKGFEQPVELSADSNDRLTTPLLPTLAIDLAALFRA